jgi:hypothetical protein
VIDVHEVAGTFLLYHIPPLVGIDGSLCDKVNILFIEAEHIAGKGKNRESVDLFMGEKTPYRPETGDYQTENGQEKGLSQYHSLAT